MVIDDSETEYLFSYGTLQTEAVQLSLFGRRLQGRADALPGYKLRMIEITERDFVIKSGTAHHRNIQFTGNDTDFVEGIVLSVSKTELEQADTYEPVSYRRVQVQLKSGLNAWAYLNSGQ